MSPLERRLADVERRAAALPTGEVPPAVREFLSGLSNEELNAVERFCALLEFGPPLALRPAERLTDQEAVAEWHRLCRRPNEGLA